MNLSSVAFRPGSIWINGQPVILLTSSLFYFRIPAAEWRSRMRTLRQLGYNAVDVYFPWNYHELEPGNWNFDGERDVRAFLQMAKEEDLWVVARPGPYICSEWDGGSLPASLNVDKTLLLRENHPTYLQAVAGWYDHIMPVLAEFQLDQGGSVVMVQIENELDFYDCKDRAGMMSALRDMALAHGITVPLIACAGEGDLQRASGDIDGVVPVCNIYFDSRDPQIEERVRHYESIIRAQGYPLCVTETNRSHMDLRRLMAGGAKLLGPYLQVGGTDFGFTTGVTNWGDPLAFMTSYYDFGGMVSPGGKIRPEGGEAILMTKMINALGSALALATPQENAPVAIKGLAGQILALDGGGYLIGLPNPGERAVQVHLDSPDGQFPEKTVLMVAPNSCPFVLYDLPLSAWGHEGRIVYASGELVECKDHGHTFELTMAVHSAAEMIIESSSLKLEGYSGWQIEQNGSTWGLWADIDQIARIEFSTVAGNNLVIKPVLASDVTNLEKAGFRPNQISCIQQENLELTPSPVKWLFHSISPTGSDWFADAKRCNSGSLHLEQNQIYRGYGWYRTLMQKDDQITGLLVQGGADVLSIYADGQFLDTLVPGGGDAFLPAAEDFCLSDKELVVKAEIWGHANFDDHRMPALGLKSLRGMGQITAIHNVQNVTPNWFYEHNAQSCAEKINPNWPMIYFGGWSSTDEPSKGIYYRDIHFAAGQDTRVLHFPGIQVDAEVFVNGQTAGALNPYTPFVDISALTEPGKSARIAVIVSQTFRRPAGQVMLYQGTAIHGWELAGWNEVRCIELAEKSASDAGEVDFPLRFTGGAMGWLQADLPLTVDWDKGLALQLVGQDLKITAWIGEHMIGRIWLPSTMRPRMAGGMDDRMVLPAHWLREANGKIWLLVESVSPEAELRKLNIILES